MKNRYKQYEIDVREIVVQGPNDNSLILYSFIDCKNNSEQKFIEKMPGGITKEY